jgi:hypothetical protein
MLFVMTDKQEDDRLVQLMREYQRKLREEQRRPERQGAEQRRIEEHRRGFEALIKAVHKRKADLAHDPNATGGTSIDRALEARKKT